MGVPPRGFQSESLASRFTFAFQEVFVRPAMFANVLAVTGLTFSMFMAGCGGGGSGGGQPCSNPVPAITSLSPNSATQGGNALSVTITGYNLLRGAADVSGSSILEPSAGALLGQYYGADNLEQTAAKLGRTPPVHLTYYAW